MFGVSNAQVQAENLVKGYKFGPDHVPVSAADAESMKVESDKPYLQILGFASADSVQISDSIGDTKCLIPGDGSTRSEAALGSLAAALHSQGRVAIGRFVSRKNTDPQLVRAAYMIGETFAVLQSGLFYPHQLFGATFFSDVPAAGPRGRRAGRYATVTSLLAASFF